MDRDDLFEMCIAAGFTAEHVNEYERAFESLIKLAFEREREACAQVCEEEGKLWSEAGCTDTQTFGLCATVIRARGETTLRGEA